MTADQPAEALIAQVGVFALVRRQQDILLVRPHTLLLPGGPQSLPGCVLDTEAGSGLSVAEGTLRRLLLTQVGISVGEFWLVGSHVLRPLPDSPPRLNLIFGTEYGSGIPAPQPKHYKSAIWVPGSQLRERVPEWLSAALLEMDKLRPGQPSEPESAPGGGRFLRRR